MSGPLIRVLWVWGVALGAGACALAGAAPPRAASPWPAPTNPALLERAFPWAADRPLTWSDFDGAPDVTSPAVALSVYVLTYDVGCDDRGFRASVESRFLPRVSWVRTSHLLEATADRTLRHEQRHFDLSEVQARRSRMALRSLPRPCDLADADLDALLEDFGRRDAEVQWRYDRDTAHGIDAGAQARWDRTIAEWLEILPK